MEEASPQWLPAGKNKGVFNETFPYHSHRRAVRAPVMRLLSEESGHHEKRDYVLTQDVTQGEMTLKKGERVKLYIITGDDNIKVYCYSAQSEFLKANRVLILYLFEDDFTGNRFDVKTFEDRLFVLVSVWSK
jgi:type II secretion system-associated lipoprotein